MHCCIKKHNLSLRCSVFPLPLLFSWLSTILFINFQDVFFSLFYKKNFFVECLQSKVLQAASGYKRQECWHETHTGLNIYNLPLRVSRLLRSNRQATAKSKGYDQRYTCIWGKQNNKYIKNSSNMLAVSSYDNFFY